MPDVFLYQVRQIKPLTESVSLVLLQPKQQPLSYLAGQYIEVIHRDQQVSPLSIACAPKADSVVECHLFHPVENHKAQDLLRMAQEEKEWPLKGPFGACTVVQLIPDKPIIFFARGTGFAPIKAVIEALLQWHDYPPIHLYWSVSKQHDFYLLDLLKHWQDQVMGFTFTPVVTKEFAEKALTSPNLLSERVVRDHPDLSNYQVYASGPKSLIYAAFYTFQKHGLHQERFYSDVFRG